LLLGLCEEGKKKEKEREGVRDNWKEREHNPWGQKKILRESWNKKEYVRNP